MILIVAALMTALLGFGAYAIDLGSARAAKSETQSGADATAEAAAAYIAQEEEAGQTPTSSEITAQAEQIAQDNGYQSASVIVNWPYENNNNQVQVIIRADASTSLGQEAGRSSIPVQASAIAAVNTIVTSSTGTSSTVITSKTPTTITNRTTGNQVITTTSTSTGTTRSSDAALFASDTSCSGGITFKNESSGTIDGETYSDGGLSLSSSNVTFDGPVVYGSKCSSPGITGESATSTTQTWPADYSGDIAAICGTSKLSSAPITITGSTVNGAYCTTGKITIDNTSGLTGKATFVGGTINVEDNSSFEVTPYYGDLTLYQTGTSPLLIESNSNWLGGTVFAPNATVDIVSNSSLGNWNGAEPQYDGYVEAKDIVLDSNSAMVIEGDGPGATATTTTSTSLGTTTTKTTVTNYTTSTSTSYATSSTVTTTPVTSTSGSKLVG